MITMPPTVDDNERAIRQARVELEAALADVRSGLDKVEEAIELFKRLEDDLVSGRRRLDERTD